MMKWKHFLLELLGSEGKRLLDWDDDTMKTEVSAATHAVFRDKLHEK